MEMICFKPAGNTVTFTADTTAPTPVQCVQAGTGPLSNLQYRIINAGTGVVFLGVGATAATATANAVLVTSSQGAIPLLPGTDEILSFSPNAYFTGITASGTDVIYITPGTGL